MATAKVTPIREVPEPSTPTFDEIESSLNDWLCILSCAVAALGTTQALDGCEIGSRAAVALGQCVENLHQLRDDLDQWNVTHDHTPKAPVRS